MGDWSITLGERPIRGGFLTSFLLGRHVSHSFTCVQDDQGKDVMQIHGVYSNRNPKTAIFNSVANMITGRQHHFSHLQVEVLTTPHLMKVFTANCKVVHTLKITGTRDKILRDAECMVRVARQVDKHQFDYFFNPIANTTQDCHTLSSELLRRIGSNINAASSPFRRPGSETNLEEIEPSLAAINVDRTSPLDKVITHLGNEIAEISPDWHAVRSSPPWISQSNKLPCPAG
ncbi:MAG: hypothetical protein WCD70_04600 [Alphaproteobacteria bacterium]